MKLKIRIYENIINLNTMKFNTMKLNGIKYTET